MSEVPNSTLSEADQRLLAEKDELIARQQLQIDMFKNLLKEEVSNKQSFARSLRLQMSKNEELINAVPWIVILISKDLKYSDANRYFTSLFELTPEDFIDKEVGALGEDESLVSTIKRFHSQSTYSITQEEIHFTKDNIERHYLLILFQNSMSEQISVVGLDITKRVQIEQDLLSTKEEAEKTALHLEKAFLETNRLMEEAQTANKTKSQFLASMSHELRTPLNGVIGMASILGTYELDNEIQEYVDIILSSAEGLLKIINDLLDYSKAEAGKIELECIPFDVQETVGYVTQILTYKTEEKHIGISYEISKDIPQIVHGDPNRLKQILINLVNNAIKFTHQGSVSIRVSLLDHKESRQKLLFEVIDTGIGIPTEKTAQLFQAFVQVDSSTTRRYGGTGLGLAICKQLVELMDGQIGVQSKVGEGSTFWFHAWL